MSETGPIFSSFGNLSIGSAGQDVSDVQLSLNNRPPSSSPQLDPDGIFGKMTDTRVREFQRNNRLVVDGIVGPQTRAALAGNEPGISNYGCDCCQPEDLSMGQNREYTEFFRNNRVNAGSQFGFTGSGITIASAATGCGPLRMLDDTQKAFARTVYGESLDFSTIYISTKKGFGGRKFTAAFPDSNETVQIMALGSYSPGRNLLIHELAHVWQSQHHSNKYRFMYNAVDSMKEALKASGLAIFGDPMVSLNHWYPMYYPFDAYAYDPSAPFSSLAAEQMAKAIENGEVAIVAHIKGVTMNMVDSSCVTALSKPGYADHRLPGIK